MYQREEKIKSLITEIASKFIERESNHNSLITVTNIELSNRTKNATILVTVLPDNQENAVIDFLKRQRSNFKQFFKEKSKLSPVPFFDFGIDQGEKARQKIDELI